MVGLFPSSNRSLLKIWEDSLCFYSSAVSWFFWTRQASRSAFFDMETIHKVEIFWNRINAVWTSGRVWYWCLKTGWLWRGEMGRQGDVCVCHAVTNTNVPFLDKLTKKNMYTEVNAPELDYIHDYHIQQFSVPLATESVLALCRAGTDAKIGVSDNIYHFIVRRKYLCHKSRDLVEKRVWDYYWLGMVLRSPTRCILPAT